LAKDRTIVYQKPTCTTCRKLFQLLEEDGVDFQRVDYFVDPIPRDKLADLLARAGVSPRDALRTRAPQYAELGLGDPAVGAEAILDAMAEHPDLIQRPIVERGGRVVIARPVERVREIL